MLQLLSRLRPESPPFSRLLLFLIVLLGSWCVLLATTGGIDLRGIGIPLSSRDPLRPTLLTLALLIVYAVRFRDDAAAHLTALRSACTRRAPLLAIGLALYTLVIGLRFGIFVAGSADVYGYVSQADLWLKGDLTIEQPLGRELPWDNGEWSLAPLGYRPSVSGGAIVPIYAPGLPLMMALGKAACGDCGPYLVVPLCGALLVWFTFLLGARVATRNVGLAAAALMASSPAFAFMLLSPMSDVPIAAILVGALVVALSRVRGRAFWTGLVMSAGLMVRPNLVPLPAIFLAFLVLQETGWRQRFKTVVAFGAGVLPAVVAIAVIHTYLYGVPWKSGYGSLDELYAWRYLWTNVAQYTQWLTETQTPLLFFFVVPLIAARRLEPGRRGPLLFLGAFTGGLFFCYLFYLPFDEWFFLRFLLSAYPPMLLLAIAGWDLAARALRPAYRFVAVFVVAVGVIAYQTSFVQDSYMLKHWQNEAAYENVGRYVGETLPENAVILSFLHSGSLRLYSGRLTLRYDWLPKEWWPRALDVLVAKGYRPYVVLTEFELPEFRRHFGLPDTADAPGTLIAELPRPIVRLYDPLRQTEVPAGPAPMPIRIPRPCGWY